MANAVNWFEIYVDEMERARAFYEAVFGVGLTNLPTPDEGEMWTFPFEMGAPNAAGSLIKHPAGSPGPGGTMVYFQCEDVAEQIGRVPGAGGTVIQDKTSIGDYGFIAMFKDTEGNVVGLHSIA